MSDTSTQQEYSNMITLLLAWQIARYTGKSQAAAVKKCARKLKAQTKSKKFYESYKTIGNARSDDDVVRVAQNCFNECKRLGYI
ncbi:MAG: hypothetical protein K0U08_05460 [Proteobacteria bacterium]|nr:hypothetical protein [Pseudomonadota bacterium]